MLIERSKCFLFDLPSSQGIVAGLTGKHFNLNFKNQSPVLFKEALKELASVCRLAVDSLVFFEQVHGNESVQLTADSTRNSLQSLSQNRLIRADAAYTNEERLAILIFTADCVPLFVRACNGDAVGLLHVGWRGAQSGIISKTLNQMMRAYQLNSDDLSLMIGPSIRSCCYEVGSEFKKYFQGCVLDRGKKHFMDLTKFILSELAALGISKDQVLDTDICTFCDSRFHSYRREGEGAGRMASFIFKRSS